MRRGAGMRGSEAVGGARTRGSEVVGGAASVGGERLHGGERLRCRAAAPPPARRPWGSRPAARSRSVMNAHFCVHSRGCRECVRKCRCGAVRRPETGWCARIPAPGGCRAPIARPWGVGQGLVGQRGPLAAGGAENQVRVGGRRAAAIVRRPGAGRCGAMCRRMYSGVRRRADGHRRQRIREGRRPSQLTDPSLSATFPDGDGGGDRISVSLLRRGVLRRPG